MTILSRQVGTGTGVPYLTVSGVPCPLPTTPDVACHPATYGLCNRLTKPNHTAGKVQYAEANLGFWHTKRPPFLTRAGASRPEQAHRTPSLSQAAGSMGGRTPVGAHAQPASPAKSNRRRHYPVCAI